MINIQKKKSKKKIQNKNKKFHKKSKKLINFYNFSEAPYQG